MLHRRVFVLIATFFVSGFIVLFVLNPPIMHTTLQDSESVTGIVASIEERGGPGDVFIKLNENNSNYYINRGTERGFDVLQAKKTTLRKKVKIYYAKYWTLLDPLGRNKHVTKLVQGGEVLYDETR